MKTVIFLSKCCGSRRGVRQVRPRGFTFRHFPRAQNREWGFGRADCFMLQGRVQTRGGIHSGVYAKFIFTSSDG
jgi:hypothetical protein